MDQQLSFTFGCSRPITVDRHGTLARGDTVFRSESGVMSWQYFANHLEAGHHSIMKEVSKAVLGNSDHLACH